jgi:hemerythrin-like domain-containing protein
MIHAKLVLHRGASREVDMKPIGALMIEHRLIERMVRLLDGELRALKDAGEVDADLLASSVDFFRTYADRTHHGKGEGILFKELSVKPLSDEDRQMMMRLVEEHVLMRGMVDRLAAAHEQYAHGVDTRTEITHEIDMLVTFYPLHIRKEDKQFFLPAMNYLSEAEQDAMLDEFWEFDGKMIHEKYKALVEENEKVMAH